MKRTGFFLILCILMFGGQCFAQKTGENLKKGISYLNAGKIDKAIEYFEQLTKDEPDNSMAFFYLGNAYLKKGNITGAKECYEKAGQIDPSNATFHYNLGLVNLMQKDTDKALEEFTLVKKMEPRSLLAKKADEEISAINRGSRAMQLLKMWKEKETLLLSEKAKEETAMVRSGGQLPAGMGMPGKAPNPVKPQKQI